MNITIDIETLPDQREGALERHIQDAREGFKAPSGLTKGKMVDDLKTDGIKLEQDGKYIPAGDMKSLWESHFKDKKVPEVAEAEWRKTALNDDCTICVVVIKSEEEVAILTGTEIEILTDLVAYVEGWCRLPGSDEIRKPFFIGHNLIWDLTRLQHKLWMYGIQAKFKFPFSGRHGHDYFCTMQAWCGYKDRISMVNLAERLGLSAKTDLSGDKVWDAWKAGEKERVAAYCLEDVNVTHQIWEKISG